MSVFLYALRGDTRPGYISWGRWWVGWVGWGGVGWGGVGSVGGGGWVGGVGGVGGVFGGVGGVGGVMGCGWCAPVHSSLLHSPSIERERPRPFQPTTTQPKTKTLCLAWIVRV